MMEGSGLKNVLGSVHIESCLQVCSESISEVMSNVVKEMADECQDLTPKVESVDYRSNK